MQSPPNTRSAKPQLLGESLAIRRLRSHVQRIAPYFRTALIQGEIGSGKELVARAIHGLSPAAEGLFVTCTAAILTELLSETNSPRAIALLESAHEGTLFLDGVGELPFAVQASLLRLLRSCTDRAPLGAASRPWNTFLTRRPEVRIIASSHRDLRTLSAVGQFRQDLYTRLSAVELQVPALRQRAEDIPALAAQILRRFARKTGQAPKSLSAVAIARLERHPWPENFRELQRTLVQAASLADVTIEAHHFAAFAEPLVSPSAPLTVKVARLHDVMQQHVLDVLTRCAGNKLRAAELLGISRSTLYRMLDASSVSVSAALK